MAQGSVVKDIRKGVWNGRWLARYRDPSNVQRKKTFARKIDAERFLTATETAKATGNYVDPAAGKRTVGNYATEAQGQAAGWLDRQAHLTAKSASSQRSLWRSQVEPRWATVTLAGVNHGDVQGWVNDLKATGLSPSRTRQAYHLLTAILDGAVRDGLIATNRGADVKLPKLTTQRRRYLSHDDLARFAEAAGPRWRPFVLTMGYTGMRWGEITELRVRDFDQMRARLNVVHAVSDVDGKLIVGDAKDHERRSVAIGRTLADELTVMVAGRSPDDLLFPGARGGHLRNQNARRDWWDAAAAEADLDGITPHELRHTAASLAVQAGAHVLAVSRMLGHARPSMTLDTYADLFDTDLDDVAARMDAGMVAAQSLVPQMCHGATVTDFGSATG